MIWSTGNSFKSIFNLFKYIFTIIRNSSKPQSPLYLPTAYRIWNDFFFRIRLFRSLKLGLKYCFRQIFLGSNVFVLAGYTILMYNCTPDKFLFRIENDNCESGYGKFVRPIHFVVTQSITSVPDLKLLITDPDSDNQNREI